MMSAAVAGRLVAAGGYAVLIALAIASHLPPETDARVYYDAVPGPALYASSTLDAGGYVYSPAFALALEPLRLLPFEVFLDLVRIVGMVSLGYLVTPWVGVLMFLVGFPGVHAEIGAGNLDLPLAAALVWVGRAPALWAPVLLTKLTPGVGILWHVARGEWRQLAIVASVTATIVLASLPFAFDSWPAWGGALLGENVAIADAATEIPYPARAAMAAALVLGAARASMPWILPIAVFISFPLPNVAHMLVLLASIRLWRSSWNVSSPASASA